MMVAYLMLLASALGGLVVLVECIDAATTWAFGVVLVQTPNGIDPVHLVEVTAEMRRLGVPRVRAVSVPGGGWAALEGSHRVVAALASGQCIEVIPVGSDERLEVGELWDAETLEPILLTMGDYVRRYDGPAYRILARRIRVLDPA